MLASAMRHALSPLADSPGFLAFEYTKNCWRDDSAIALGCS